MDRDGIVSDMLRLLTNLVGSDKMEESIRALPSLFRHDPSREDDVYNLIDGLIDIYYYLCDSCVRIGLHHIIDDHYLHQVREFTFGAFAKEGDVPTKTNDNINATMDFVVKMCTTELVEIVAPKAEATDIQPIVDEWCDNLVSTNRPSSVQILMIAVLAVFDRIKKAFPSVAIFETAFNEVHSANMKKGQIVDGKVVFTTRIEGGKPKIIKPDGWVGPDIKRALEGHSLIPRDFADMV